MQETVRQCLASETHLSAPGDIASARTGRKEYAICVVCSGERVRERKERHCALAVDALQLETSSPQAGIVRERERQKEREAAAAHEVAVDTQ